MKLFQVILFTLLFASCNTSNKEAVQNDDNSPNAPEAEAIKKAVADAYRCINFKQGQPLDFAEIKKCFIPEARLISFRDDTMNVLTMDQFIDLYKEFIEENHIHSFYEEEIKGSTDQFGRIAQRMSTYKTYINTMDSVAERGVNSFQLVKTLQGWKVSGIIWDIETQKLRIPNYYLKADAAR